MATDFTLLDDQMVSLSITETDDAGNTVSPVQGTVTWASSDDTIVSVVDNGDGTATASAVGPLGSADVSLSADVTDNSGNSTTINDVLSIHVNTSSPVGIAIVPGTPAHK